MTLFYGVLPGFADIQLEVVVSVAAVCVCGNYNMNTVLFKRC
jgi:hypothetical protein